MHAGRGMRDNLIIDGLPDSNDESTLDCEKKTVDFLKDTVKVPNAENLVIGRVHRIGPFKDNKCRSTIVKFDQYKHREQVYRKGKNLPTNGAHRIKENFSRESEKARGLLYPIMKLAREKGYFSKLEGNRLIVRDRVSINVTCTVHCGYT